MLNDRLLTGCDAILEKYNLPGYTVGISSKGCVTFSPEKITDYASFQRSHDGELNDLAWLYMMNRGVFMTPGREEEWTLSVAHSAADADAYVTAFEEMANDLVG
jgi:glutamate-1-semialdehyde 2,1-aminomutase